MIDFDSIQPIHITWTKTFLVAFKRFTVKKLTLKNQPDNIKTVCKDTPCN